METPPEITRFLRHFHPVGADVDTVFTCGCCYWFAFILCGRFPTAQLVYDQEENHFAVRIGGQDYDITGNITEQYSMEPWNKIDAETQERILRDCAYFGDMGGETE